VDGQRASQRVVVYLSSGFLAPPALCFSSYCVSCFLVPKPSKSRSPFGEAGCGIRKWPRPVPSLPAIRFHPRHHAVVGIAQPARQVKRATRASRIFRAVGAAQYIYLRPACDGRLRLGCKKRDELCSGFVPATGVCLSWWHSPVAQPEPEPA